MPLNLTIIENHIDEISGENYSIAVPHDFSLRPLEIEAIRGRIPFDNLSYQQWHNILAQTNCDSAHTALVDLNHRYWQLAHGIDVSPFNNNDSTFSNHRELVSLLNLLNQQILKLPNSDNDNAIISQAQLRANSLQELNKLYIKYEKLRNYKTELLMGMLFFALVIFATIYTFGYSPSTYLFIVDGALALLTMSVLGHVAYREHSTLENLRYQITSKTTAYKQEVENYLRWHPLQSLAPSVTTPQVQTNNNNFHLEMEISYRMQQDLKISNHDCLGCSICLDEKAVFTRNDLQHPNESKQQPVFTLLTDSEQKPSKFMGPYHLRCLETYQQNTTSKLADPNSGSHSLATSPRQRHFQFFQFPLHEINSAPEQITGEDLRINIWR